MAYVTGTATNHVDLWDKLIAFLKTDATLVAAGQQWTTVWQHATRPNEELLLKGPGLAGTDEVYVGLYRTDNALVVGESIINIAGATGVVPTAERYYDHVNALPRRPFIFLDQAPMQYWFVANGRRFVVVVKISTVYQAMYGGFYLPYAPPSTYPAPLFIGGTVGFVRNSNTSAENVISWRASEVDSYRHFVYPFSSPGATFYYDSQAFLLAPEGAWRGGTISQTTLVNSLPAFRVSPRSFPGYMGTTNSADSTPGYSNITPRTLGYSEIRAMLAAGLNDEFSLTPITLLAFNDSPSPAPVTYGILDGCFSVPGIGNAAENLITVAGVNHLVVPNVMRTDVREYWALALE